jgi:hypothetical protein
VCQPLRIGWQNNATAPIGITGASATIVNLLLLDLNGLTVALDQG